MNIKKVKNRGFSLMISIVASLILMGVSVGIIASVNRSLDQTSNIARSNQFFFAAESGQEAAFFHHNVRGAGLSLSNNLAINHGSIGANVTWTIDGREDSAKYIEGMMHENEKITIPLYWDSSSTSSANYNDNELDATQRQSLKLSFSVNPVTFDFGVAGNEVLMVWSVSRIHNTDGIQTFIPTTDNQQYPCGSTTPSVRSSFYCKTDLLCAGPGVSCSGHLNFTSGIIDFNDNLTIGKILPTGTTKVSLQTFMRDTNSSNYEISFQPVLPFIDSSGNKFSHLNFKFLGDSPIKIPRNIYKITSSVTSGNFDKKTTLEVKEKPSIGAFDYLIFQ